MASPFGATSTVGLMAAPSGIVSDKKPFSLSSISLADRPRHVRLQRKCNFRVKAAKELYFNKDGSATKKLQVSFTLHSDPILSSHYIPDPGDRSTHADELFVYFRLESTSWQILLELHWGQREGMLFWRASTAPLRLSMMVLQLQERYVAYYHVTRQSASFSATLLVLRRLLLVIMHIFFVIQST